MPRSKPVHVRRREAARRAERALGVVETFEGIEEGTAGARERTRRRARSGAPDLNKNQEMSQKRRDATQYRACRALMWDRERTLLETGWSLQWLFSVEKFVADEDRSVWSETDARVLFAAYRDQQLQIVRELEDVTQIFRNSKQYNAVVSSLRTRAEVLERIMKMGQELGVVHKTARQVEVSGAVDITQLTVVELRARVKAQVAEVRELIAPAEQPDGTAGVVLRRLTGGKFGAAVEAAEPPPAKPAPSGKRARRKPRVKRPATSASAGTPRAATGEAGASDPAA